MLCYAVGYGLMIFSGSLERYASVGIPSLLVGVFSVGLVVALWSSQQFCIARPDSNTAAILAVSLSGIELGAVVVVALTETALAHSETLYRGESNTVKASETTRLLGVWTSVLCLTIVIAFPALISFLPKPVLAGLLLYLSVSMLLEWVIASRRRLPVHEYALLLLILGATVLTGFLAGALLGLTAACVLFAWNYGRVTCIKSAFTGQSYRSRVRRTVRDDKILAEHGASTFGLSLQGYLFFGTAQIIVDRVTEATRQTERRVIVIDMQAVRGMDASALMCFRKLRQLCQPRQIALVFAGLDDKQRALLRRCEVLDKAEFDFVDLDHALEWIEARILNEFSGAPTEASLRKMLAPHFHSQNLERLLFLLEPVVFEPGEVVLNRSERGDSLFFIERGQLGVKFVSGSGEMFLQPHWLYVQSNVQ